MSLEIDAKMSQISRNGGVEGMAMINYEGIVIKGYNLTDFDILNKYAYLAVQMSKTVKQAFDIISGDIDILRIKSTSMEYVLIFEEDYILVAIYKQTNLKDFGKVEEEA